MASRSWEIVGTIDDLTDVITNISPDQTPLLKKFSKTKATQTTHGALTDTLPTAAIPSINEGDDFTTVAANPRGKIENYTQIFDRGYYVTDTDEAVLKKGVTSEIEYQMGLAMKAIALDQELAIVTSATAQKQSGSAYGKMGGIPYFNALNNQDMGSAAVTEAKLNDAIYAAWVQGGVPELAITSGKNKRAISGFTASATKFRDQGEKTLVNLVNIYESDFGTVTIMAHRQQVNSRIDIIEPQHFKVAPLIPFHKEDLPKKGHRVEKVITGQVTLECRSELAQAAITGIVPA